MNDTNQGPISAVQLAKRLLNLTSATWVDVEEFKAIAALTKIPPGEAKVDFLQRLIALIKRMPEKLMEREVKEKVIQAGQDALDLAIDEEEELLQQGDESTNNPTQ